MSYEARHVARSRPLYRRVFVLGIAALIVIIAVGVLAGCTSDAPTKGAQGEGQQQTEDTFSRLSKEAPYPHMTSSLERHNLIRKLEAENKPNQIGYVYLQSFGKVLGYYTIKGKVSSNNSQMTTDQLVIDGCPGGSDGRCPTVVNAPGDDGSYGPNEPGVFFFTTEGTLVKTDLDYVYSTQPLPFDVPQLNK
jgi:hypothetical protein